MRTMDSGPRTAVNFEAFRETKAEHSSSCEAPFAVENERTNENEEGRRGMTSKEGAVGDNVAGERGRGALACT